MDCDMEEINPDYIHQLDCVHFEDRCAQALMEPLTDDNPKLIKENMRCGPSVSSANKDQYLQMVLKHHSVVSAHKLDLSQTDTEA